MANSARNDPGRRLLGLMAFVVLAAPRAVYHLVIRLRNLAFSRGWLEVSRVAAPVISVGNIAAGGTGKTPMVEWIARALTALGRRPAVLSRGYGGQKSGGVDDENEVLRQRLGNLPVLVGADRLASARRALEAGSADCFVMDDGFQHRRLARDLDIVMVDPDEDPLRILLHREPISALARADAVVLIPHLDEGRAALADYRRRLGAKTVCLARRVVTGLVDVRTGEKVSLPGDVRAGAFCGLGNPAAFRATVEAVLGAPPVFFQAFPDHYAYPPAAVESLLARASAAGADVLLTTAKDAVKLRAVPAPAGGIRLVCVDMTLEITAGEEALLDALDRAVGRVSGA